MVDYRLEWFKERVLTLLGETDDGIFLELLAREDGGVRDQLITFISQDISAISAPAQRLLFFYKTYHEKIIQHEVVIAKEVKGPKVQTSSEAVKPPSDDESSETDHSEHSQSPPLPPAPPSSAVKGKKPGAGAKKGKGSLHRASTSSEGKGGKKSAAGGGKGGKKGRKSPTTVVETVTDVEDSTSSSLLKDDPTEEPQEEQQQQKQQQPEVTYVTRIDQEVVLLSVLHCRFGGLSEQEQNLKDTPFLMFIRRWPNGVLMIDSWDTASDVLPASFLVGSFLGPVLPALCILLEKVFTPLLTGTSEDSPSRSSSLDEAAAGSRTTSVSSTKLEAPIPGSRATSIVSTKAPPQDKSIPGLLQSLKPMMQWLLHYEQSHIKFSLPSEVAKALDKAEGNEETLKELLPKLEAVSSEWIGQIQEILNNLDKQKCSDEGPTAEVVYWEEQETGLSSLHWKAQGAAVLRLQEALDKTDSAFSEQLSEIRERVGNLLAEARAITRSLTPAAAHFKELNDSSSLVAMRHILVRLMDCLRLVWVLCSPYAQDHRMQPLLGRLAWLLCHKVAVRLDMDTLFKQGAEKALQKAKQGARLLHTWKDLYFQTRQIIEESGHTPRWEFDCKKLFGHSEYIREVCTDLTEVCKVLIQFRSVLTPELKAAISNPTAVDALLRRVSFLLAPIQQDSDFEVFVAGNADSWRSFMNHMRRDVILLEQDVCEFLHNTFSVGNISTSREALNLLLLFSAVDTRDNIRSVLMSKFELVISQFLVEIEEVRATFLARKDSPPLLRNQPQAAGSIFWCRCLFNKLKTSVLVFQEIEPLQKCPLTQEAFSAYVQLTRQMKSYQDEHYEVWVRRAEETIKSTMHTHLIKITKKYKKRKSGSTVDRRWGGLLAPTESRAERSSSESTRLMLRPVLASLRWVARAVAARKRASTGSEGPFVLPQIGLAPTSASVASLGLQYEVEFNDLLLQVLAEAELMEHLGLELTPLIRRTAITRSELDQVLRNLRETISNLNNLLSPLDEAEVSLLQAALKATERSIEPGVNRLKWTSRMLPEYCEACKTAVTSLSSSVALVQLTSRQAAEKVASLKNFNLFYVPQKVLPWEEYFKEMEKHRSERMASMLKVYGELSSILVTLEHWIDNTSTGRKPCMNKYYLHWEQQLFEALLAMVMKNMEHFCSQLIGEEAFFQMDATLQGTELCLKPTPLRAFEIVVANLAGLLNGLKQFVRWMSGTCQPCPTPQLVPASQQPNATKLFTFLDEVAKVRQVREQIAVIREAVQEVLVKASSHLQRWKKYSLLWQYDKAQTCAVFAAKKPTLVAYDKKFVYFSSIIQKLERASNMVDIGCIRLNLCPLVAEIKEHAVAWKFHLAQGLAANTKKRMREFIWNAKGLQADMEQEVDPENVESLKEVMEAIIKIRQSTTEAEVQAGEIEESYRTLTLHDIQVDEGDVKMSQELWPMWECIYLSSLVRREELADLTERYAQATQEAVANFLDRCQEFVARFTEEGPGSVGSNLDQGLVLMREFASELGQLNEEREALLQDELLFDVPLADHSALKDVQQQMDGLAQVYQLYAAQKTARESWASSLWVDLTPASLLDGMDKFLLQFEALSPEAKELAVGKQLEQDMQQFQSSVPMFAALKNEALRERHWQQLMEKTGKRFDVSRESFTLQSLFSMELHQHQEHAQSIVARAEKELLIEQALLEVKLAWAEEEFTLEQHEVQGEDRGFILGSVGPILAMLEHHTVSLKSTFASPYIGPFLALAQEWEKTLALVQEVVCLWTEVQQRWTHLEHIFLDKELSAQLTPKAVMRFEGCEKLFRALMSETAKNPQVVASCCRSGCVKELQGLSSGLEACQRSLNSLLAAKRQVFPRLNFITDDSLLSLIGGEQPTSVQTQVPKLFPGVAHLQLGEGEAGQLIIMGLVSHEGEELALHPPLDTARLDVEQWLSQLVPRLRASFRRAIKTAIHHYGHSQEPESEWLLQYPGSVSLSASKVWWCVKVEDVLSKIQQGQHRAMKEYLEILGEEVNELVEVLRSPMECNDRIKLTAALVTQVHHRDVVEQLVFNGVRSAKDYMWASQLRTYWDKTEDSLLIRQCCCLLEFGYDYTGLHKRLVVTPQTDRVILIITQALAMQLGVVLSGPAGVGKTETVNDLALALGRICLVTDCSVSMDWRCVGRVLAGLAQSGVWGCLEQVDRLDPSTLSVLSSQLSIIRSAVMMRLSSFNFSGLEIGLDPKMAVFATISPGQEGRYELPQSLRSLFRPATCAQPDPQLTCHVTLLSAGFTQAKVFAKKVRVLFKLCREQLSKQPHYNFSLSSLKAALQVAEDMRSISPDTPEDQLILQAIRYTTVARLVPQDKDLFLELLKDIFPRIKYVSTEDAQLRASVVENLEADGYSVLPYQVDKVLQLSETLKCRSCAALVGSTGGGKSVILQALAKARKKLGQPTQIHILNPKALTESELLGEVKEGGVWKDGLLANMIRISNKITEEPTPTFIVFDGDVDPLWLESINSALDVNLSLTLTNGERIELKRHCSLIFEVGTLEFASPSIVSRAGVVYVNPQEMSYEVYWHRWLKSQTFDQFSGFYDKYVPPLLEATANMSTLIPFSALSKVTQLCYIIDALLVNSTPSKDTIECYFIQAIFWSLGAMLLEEHQDSFDKIVKDICGWRTVEASSTNPAASSTLPRSSLFHCFWEEETKTWRQWAWGVEAYIHDPTRPLDESLVPTLETTKTCWLLENVSNYFFHGLVFHKVQRPLILVGQPGSSKTATVLCYLRHLDLKKYLRLALACSATTSSQEIQASIEGALEKRTRDVLGPSTGKKLLVFLDDLNLPMADKFGTQKPIALLRLLFERGGFYDRDTELNWRQLKDIGFVGAITVNNGSGVKVDPRFLAQVSVVHLPRPTEGALHRIFTSFMKGHLEPFPIEVQQLAPSIVAASLYLYKVLSDTLPPTPARWMCHLSTRDLTRLFAGLCQIQPRHFSTPEALVRVWRHEVYRVFSDRLDNSQDQSLVHSNLETVLLDCFSPYSDHALRNPILFGDFRNAMSSTEQRAYEDLLDFEAVFFLFQEVLEELNRRSESIKLELVLFDTALEHLARLHRVMRMYRGHAVLVGGPGSGRRSLSLLAACAAHCRLAELPHRGSQCSPKQGLRDLFIEMGVRKQAIALLLTDTAMHQEGVPEVVDQLLTSGYVPGLFCGPDKDEVVDEVREEAVSKGWSGDREAVWQFFLSECTSRLHVVLSISRPTLRRYSLQFPSMLTCTSMDWYEAWPEQALARVAKHYIANSTLIPEDQRGALQEQAVWTHHSASQHYLQLSGRCSVNNSPRLFLDLLRCYLSLLATCTSKKKQECEQLKAGLARISQARNLLSQLGERLAEKENTVVKHTEACQGLVQKMREVSEEAEKKRVLSLEWNKNAERQDRLLTSEQAQAHQILASVKPALDKAHQDLASLQSEDFKQISRLAPPPDSVRIVCDCVLLLRGVRETTWEVASGMLADPQLVHDLTNLPCEALTLSQIRLVKVQLKKAPKFDDLPNISPAASVLLRYVEAVLCFCAALREVKPRLELIEQLERDLAQASHSANVLLEEVANEDRTLVSHQDQHAHITQELQQLQEETDRMQHHLKAAKQLFSSLNAEEIRWQKQLSEVEDANVRLPGDCLLVAAMLSYSGPLSGPEHRRQVLEEWLKNLEGRGILVTTPFKPDELLSSREEISLWMSYGSLQDDASLHNLLLMTRAVRFPLCIDPQQQAAEWVKKIEGGNGLRLLSLDDPQLLIQMEEALGEGAPVLLQDVGQILPPPLHHLMDKNILLVEGEQLVTLGDNLVSYNSNFKLYLNTRESNPQLDPVFYTKTTVIDCTITAESLEQSLLGEVVFAEGPELQDKREKLVLKKDQTHSHLEQLEDALLSRLAQASEEQLLEDPGLLSFLESTKSEISMLSEELLLTTEELANVEEARLKYQNVAQRAALVFSVLADLAHVGPTYLFSLASFRRVLQNSIREAPELPDLEDRLETIMDTLNRKTHSFACRGVFSHHQLCFTLTLVLRLQQSKGEVSPAEVYLFTWESADTVESPVDWLTAEKWTSVSKLHETLPEIFGNLLEDLKQEEWKEWIELACPETSSFPCGYDTGLSLFQQVLLLRFLRRDRVIPAVQNYIRQTLDEFFITPQLPNLRSLLTEGSPCVPNLLVLSPGSDPSEELQLLSKQSGRDSGQFVSLALGKGQEKNALGLLETAVRRGQWLLLLNCHLLPALLVQVVQLLESATLHPDFRLWLTSLPTPQLPARLLQNSLKVVLETPFGIKLKLLSIFENLEAETTVQKSNTDLMRIVYVLAHFHAILQERMHFGNFGWNLCYNFTKADLHCSMNSLASIVNVANKRTISWTSLQSFVGQVIYGGHISDFFDQRVVSTYLQEFCGDFVFHDSFCFYQDTEVSYTLPPELTTDGIMNYVKSLPLENSPHVLGLHLNAEILCNTNASKDLAAAMSQLRPQTNVGGQEESREQKVRAVVAEVIARLPSSLDPRELLLRTVSGGPSLTFILHELQAFNHLLSAIHKSLALLDKALQGTASMDHDLEELLDSLDHGQVPQLWRKLCPPTSKSLYAWVHLLKQRYDQYYNWVMKHEPLVVWLPGLHAPRSFLISVMQAASRKYHWALEAADLRLKVTALKHLHALPEGVYISGMHLEGAAWDKNGCCLLRPRPGQLTDPLPVVVAVPVSTDLEPVPGSVRTPLYATRWQPEVPAELVWELDLPCAEHPNTWALQGVRLLLDPD